MTTNNQHQISVTVSSARDLGDLLSQAELSLRPTAAALAAGITVTRHSFEKYSVAVDGSVPAGETRERTIENKIDA